MEFAESEITKIKKSLTEFRKLFDEAQNSNSNGANGNRSTDGS
jgi:hypothetical protein